jgi:3-deoxy-manno-octulosonate cytidylyltransferase (CMP-KDO synthetase)
MYAYRSDVLKRITSLKVSALEKAESLEQLRWLENGFKIKTIETTIETVGIDTPEDLEHARQYLKHHNG